VRIPTRGDQVFLAMQAAVGRPLHRKWGALSKVHSSWCTSVQWEWGQVPWGTQG